MARPKNCRRIGELPQCTYYKPQGIPLRQLQEVIINIDEFEAIRLADFEGLYQETAAKEMEVSRQTFGRILDAAHKKLADALIHGKALKIEGGDIMMADTRKFQCSDCRHTWDAAFGTGRPAQCPACSSSNFHREVSPGARGGKCRRNRNRQGTAGN